MTNTLITPSSLAGRLGDRALRILDATAFLDLHPDKTSGYVPRCGRPEWEGEHIPGAQHVDLVTAFSEARSPFPFTMPSPEKFCELAGALGIADDNDVVVYSAGNTMWATRLWWMFRSVGFERCAVLDGGLETWKTEKHATDKRVPHFPPGRITVKPSTLGWASKVELVEHLKSGGKTCVIDALSPRDYSGEHAKYGGRGHIPGSHNVFHFKLLDDNGAFLPVEKLRERFAPSHALESERVICYCGGGIASTVTAMAAYLCGHRNVAVYDGSLLEWASDKSLPLKTGELP